MQKELLKNTKFQSTIKKFFTENKHEILDILLFGSIIKGAGKPNDVDILLINLNKPDTNRDYALRKNLEKMINKKVQVTSVTYSDLHDSSFMARAAFLEGYSMIYKKNNAESLGFKPLSLFKYALNNLSKSERMIFYYALYGRDNKGGIIKMTKALKLSPEVILCPLEYQEELKEFFKNRNISYDNFTVLFPILMFEHLIGQS